MGANCSCTGDKAEIEHEVKVEMNSEGNGYVLLFIHQVIEV